MNVTKEEMKYRQLQIEDYLQMVSVEQKEYAEVYTSSRITENNITNTDMSQDNLQEKILDKDNLNQVYKRAQAQESILDYILHFYNCKRIHGTVGYKTPITYEKEYYKQKKAS